MAEATAVPTVVKSWFDSGGYNIIGTLAIDASPAEYEAGGILMNMNQAAIKASRTPIRVAVKGISGYSYEYVAGTDNSNGLLIIRAQKASASDHDPLTELADDTAIPAGVSGDTVTFEATWKGML